MTVDMNKIICDAPGESHAAVVDAVYVRPAAVRAQAKRDGWVTIGEQDYCPRHAPES